MLKHLIGEVGVLNGDCSQELDSSFVSQFRKKHNFSLLKVQKIEDIQWQVQAEM
jgi:hypothetical protein